MVRRDGIDLLNFELGRLSWLVGRATRLLKLLSRPSYRATKQVELPSRLSHWAAEKTRLSSYQTGRLGNEVRLLSREVKLPRWRSSRNCQTWCLAGSFRIEGREGVSKQKAEQGGTESEGGTRSYRTTELRGQVESCRVGNRATSRKPDCQAGRQDYWEGLTIRQEVGYWVRMQVAKRGGV